MLDAASRKDEEDQAVLGEGGSNSRGDPAQLLLGANGQPAGHIPSVKFLSKKKPRGSWFSFPDASSECREAKRNPGLYEKKGGGRVGGFLWP